MSRKRYEVTYSTKEKLHRAERRGRYQVIGYERLRDARLNVEDALADGSFVRLVDAKTGREIKPARAERRVAPSAGARRRSANGVRQ
jgi:hypothetical protein